MSSRSCSSWLVPVSKEIEPSASLFTPGVSLLPDDFVKRLTRLKQATGLTWDGFAVCLGVDNRQVLRWRQGGAPCGGAMLAMVRLALQVPGGLAILLGEA